MAFSCQGSRAVPESELAQLLPWSKESETLPLETKESIHHFSCQEYIQPTTKYCLRNSAKQKPSISSAMQSQLRAYRSFPRRSPLSAFRERIKHHQCNLNKKEQLSLAGLQETRLSRGQAPALSRDCCRAPGRTVCHTHDASKVKGCRRWRS